MPLFQKYSPLATILLGGGLVRLLDEAQDGAHALARRPR